MPTKTKFELKMGMATREAFGKTLAKLGDTLELARTEAVLARLGSDD